MLVPQYIRSVQSFINDGLAALASCDGDEHLFEENEKSSAVVEVELESSPKILEKTWRVERRI